MLVYPQLASGAISQFPVQKRVTMRTIVNRASDGSAIRAADPAATVTEWALSYTDLSDSEAGTLEQFFTSAEGSLNGFTFLDPAGNLFASSDQLAAAVWEKDPLLTATAGSDDPRGGKLAWQLQNSGAGSQTLAQTLPAPTGYLYCLSVYVMAAQAVTVALTAGSQSADRTVTAQWSRIAFTTTPDAPRFGIEIPAGASVTVYGMQVEPQPSPSAYQSTTVSGVYENARLKDDTLKITATGYNRHSCTVNIIHANHL
ncbi:MAG TPA: hypothetical protein VHA14_16395 [Bryobacteraceae bacterium]|nr:hypothetical protein [Bryobacteraceae bacterium]